MRRPGQAKAAYASVLVVALALGAGPLPAHGQQSRQASVWFDANAAHSRPPAGAAVDPTNYGLLGLRLLVDGGRSRTDAGVTGGHGMADGSGAWLTGRLATSTAHVFGLVDLGVRGEVDGLTWLVPVRLEAGEYTQWTANGTLSPYAGLSLGRFRLGAEGRYTRGVWQTTITTGRGGPGLPGPIGGGPLTETTHADGDVVILGGSVSLLRMFSGITMEVRGSTLEVSNALADGNWSGVDASATLSLGEADVLLGGRYWTSPVSDGELGGHVGFGVPLNGAMYLQALASRTVTDPVHAVPGAVALSAGVSLRVGQRRLGPPPPAELGAMAGNGRRVVFTLVRRDARTVDVAGDFSGWERRPLRSGADGTWTLETVIPAGVYHYAFVVDGEHWVVPDGATGIVDDGFGQKNATLIVADREER
ncbi:MAG TPA: glycogen-binding domain-containing protein [Longimicrobiales bacterium]|nr:glycogen-binding domain-containing protein [Longimicrobiales bacterium]